MRHFSSVALYSDTELKPSTKKVDFLTKAIDCKAPLPFDQAWSRASKKVGPLQSIDQEPEKCESEVVKIVWELGSILSLSTEFEPRAEKNIFVDKVVSEYP